jgi:NAD(P) transhydrogenase subunit alpha
MRIVIPAETWPGERRVAATPESVANLKKLGFSVVIAAGAGAGAGLTDEVYAAAGAEICTDPEALYEAVTVVLRVRAPDEAELAQLPEGVAMICLLSRDETLLQALSERKISALSLNGVPRITRAQKMDVLSSMANIAGYRAVIEASTAYRGFFGLQMTAAGTAPPARVLVIGAGVAGLAAIGTARSLGAEVRAFDVRAEVREQVQSMGARFLAVELEEEGAGAGGYAKTMSPAFIAAEMALFKEQCREVDVIITTALIPGRRAPVLITDEMLQVLRPGAVVVDLAAENGGNCEGTVAGECVERHGVTIIGYIDLPSRMSGVSSQFFANNIVHLLAEMVRDGDFVIDVEDEVVRGALLTHQGEILPPPPRKAPAPPPATAPAEEAVVVSGPSLGELARREEAAVALKRRNLGIGGLVAAGVLGTIGFYAPPDFVQHLTVFVLSCVVGYQVIWNVTPALHTPLMSVTNAISGIIIVGGLLQASSGHYDTAAWLGAAAILIATINVAGGFLVTQRMLQMFRKN